MLSATAFFYVPHQQLMMSVERLVCRITTHKRVIPPAAVLGLGDAFEFWVICVAQKWPVHAKLATLWSLGF